MRSYPRKEGGKEKGSGIMSVGRGWKGMQWQCIFFHHKVPPASNDFVPKSVHHYSPFIPTTAHCARNSLATALRFFFSLLCLFSKHKQSLKTVVSLKNYPLLETRHSSIFFRIIFHKLFPNFFHFLIHNEIPLLVGDRRHRGCYCRTGNANGCVVSWSMGAPYCALYWCSFWFMGLFCVIM